MCVGQRLQSWLFFVLRAPFRALPITESTRDYWRNWFFERFPSVRPGRAPLPGSLVAAPRRLHVAGSRSIHYVEAASPSLPSPLAARVIAFYLPQFHPIPENDAAWGEGYTEWRAAARAQPQFLGHVQPRVPLAGEYDLRDIAAMREQAALAKRYGVSAFCFYFYWFHGKTLLEQPLTQWLQSDIDLEFCLCWANESWTRTWDGRAGEQVVAQTHDAQDDLAFIAHIAPYLRDRRAVRVDGKPLLLVYRPGLLPDAKATAQRWRAWCRENGVGEIHLAYVQSFERPTPADIGFDAAVEFPPNLCTPSDITAQQALLHADYAGSVLDWRDLPRHFLSKPVAEYPLYPAVNCGWDNEPRRPGRGRTFLHASPRAYRDWVSETIRRRFGDVVPARRLLFVNAWNEWGEGAMLEPDTYLGHAWLQATSDALRIAALPDSPPPQRACVVIHAWYTEALGDVLTAAQQLRPAPRIVITTAPEKADEVRDIAHKRGLAVELHLHPNRGRDILPFLRTASRLLDGGESLVLKLHTKRSTHRDDGEAWREELIRGLIEDGNAEAIQRTLQEHPDIGLIALADHLQPVHDYMGANAGNVAYLTRRLGLAAGDIDQQSFPAGSMYWCRLEALRPLLDVQLSEAEFEDETGQVDGTLAHAIERIMINAVQAAGYRALSWPMHQQASRGKRFRYARRD